MTPRRMHNSSDHRKAESNNYSFKVIPSLKRSQNMLTSIYDKLRPSSIPVSRSVQKMFSLAGILRIADAARQVCFSCYVNVLGGISAISSSGNAWNVPLSFVLLYQKQRNLVSRASRLRSIFLAIMLYYWLHFPHNADVFQIWTTPAACLWRIIRGLWANHKRRNIFD